MTTINVSSSPEAQAALAGYRRASRELPRAIRMGLKQGLDVAANHLRLNYLSGQHTAQRRGGVPPLGVRSGQLRGAVESDVESDLSGYVGVLDGTPAARYARTQLGAETTTITPQRSKHLWIPIADNLNPSGLATTSPRQAMEQRTVGGKRALRIFKSKAGNLVAFLPEGRLASNTETRQQGLVLTGGRFSRGKKKGQAKGKLLFVLKDRVEVKGTDALARAVEDKSQEIADTVTRAIAGAFTAGDQA